MTRRQTPTVFVGPVPMGSRHPIVIQSMTNTPTANVTATVRQIQELADAGSDLVRITLNTDAAMKAVPQIIQKLKTKRCKVPLIGDFHYNGHILLQQYPQSAKLLSKYRINPGNIGKGNTRDQNFEQIIKIAIQNKKPVRIGVNAGSLDQDLLARLLKRENSDERSERFREILIEAMVQSALQSAQAAQKLGLTKNKVVLSVKMSGVRDMITVYEKLAARCDHVLHLGLTEAGSGIKGTVASTAALAILLQKGIGDTIRVSLTPSAQEKRSQEVETGKALLQSLGLRYFSPEVISCPGCGRTSSHYFEQLAQATEQYIQKQLPTWKKKYKGIEQLKIAVMGCIVNGPGESKHADIGISLPGDQENPKAMIYVQGKNVASLKGKTIKTQFLSILENYIRKTYR